MEKLKKVLSHLENMEWADGSDMVSIGIKNLLSNMDTMDEETIANTLFELYFADRSRHYHSTKESK